MSINEELKEISNRLKKAMVDSGLSFGEVSNITGIPKSAIHRYVTGNTPKIPITRLEQLAEVFGVSAAYLMGWEEPTDKTEQQTDDELDKEIIEGYSRLTDENKKIVDEHIERLLNLSDDEFKIVDGFVQGLIAKREKENIENK